MESTYDMLLGGKGHIKKYMYKKEKKIKFNRLFLGNKMMSDLILSFTFV